MDRCWPRPHPHATPSPPSSSSSGLRQSGADRERTATVRLSPPITCWAGVLIIWTWCYFGPSSLFDLRLQWRENLRGKVTAGSPISSPASTHLNSERPAGGRYVHFTHHFQSFHLDSHLIDPLSAFSCCIRRGNVRRRNRLRLNAKTRRVFSDILTPFPSVDDPPANSSAKTRPSAPDDL